MDDRVSYKGGTIVRVYCPDKGCAASPKLLCALFSDKFMCNYAKANEYIHHQCTATEEYIFLYERQLPEFMALRMGAGNG